MFSGGWELLLVLAIALVIFGAGRIKHLGSDIGNAIKGFRNAMKDDEAEKEKGVDS